MGIIKSKIIKDKGLLLQEYSGEISKNDMALYFNGLYKNPEYLHVSTIFSDFTHAIVALSVDDISEVAYFILEYAPKVQNINNAILVSEPLVTAYSILYEEIMKKMPLYKCRIFSTFNEAANFISHDINNLKKLIKISYTNSTNTEIYNVC
jgi:hypothetical protein